MPQSPHAILDTYWWAGLGSKLYMTSKLPCVIHSIEKFLHLPQDLRLPEAFHSFKHRLPVT